MHKFFIRKGLKNRFGSSPEMRVLKLARLA